MAGNVAEWTSSSTDGGARIFKGGGFGYEAMEESDDTLSVRVDEEGSHQPKQPFLDLGFRCARDGSAAPEAGLPAGAAASVPSRGSAERKALLDAGARTSGHHRGVQGRPAGRRR
jgi:hypothetical protein